MEVFIMRFFLLTAITITSSLRGYGQVGMSSPDSLIPNQTIEIIQTYRPEIIQSSKPEFSPILPVVDTAKPNFEYEVPQQTLSYSYRSVPIRPLALGKITKQLPYQNYASFGAGNLSSLYLDVGIGELKTENYITSFHLSHLSQKGSRRYQQTANTSLDAAALLLGNEHDWDLVFNFTRRGNHFYGFDKDSFNVSKKEVKQVFTGVQAIASMTNKTTNQYGVDYNPSIGIGFYQDKFDVSETSLDILLPAWKDIDENLRMRFELLGNFNLLSHVGEQWNNIVQVRPSVRYNIDDYHLDIHAGVYPTWGKAGISYLLPDFSIKSELLKNNLSVYAGWKGDLHRNTFRELSTKNPFIHNDYESRQTKIMQLFLGAEGAVSNHFKFGSTLSWYRWSHLATFVNDYVFSPEGKQFKTVYDKLVESLTIEAHAQYQYGEIFGIKGQIAWMNFVPQTYSEVWHEAAFKFGGSAFWRPIRQLRIEASTDFWDGIFALDREGNKHQLPFFFDVGISVKYNIIQRLDLFLQVHNLLDNRYERWSQYEVYGIHLIGGLTFKF